MMNDLGAPQRTNVIVERDGEMALANYDKGTWWFGPTYLTLKEQLDFVPRKWRHIAK